jgi:hypothetical protein
MRAPSRIVAGNGPQWQSRSTISLTSAKWVALSVLAAAGCARKESAAVSRVDAKATIAPAAGAAAVDAASLLSPTSSDAEAPPATLATITIAGRFAFDYPTTVLRPEKSARGITLGSKVFESYNGGHFPFRIDIVTADRNVVDEARRSVPSSLFATHDESSFVEQPDFAVRKTTRGGLRGYEVTSGVEGIGQVESFFSISPKQTLHVTCHYCCGLTETPTITMDEQLATCAAIVQSLRPAGT